MRSTCASRRTTRRTSPTASKRRRPRSTTRLDGTDITNPPPAIVTRTNVNRAVEWYKAPATYNGGIGFVETGALTAPQSGFERHAAALLPLKTSWGLA